MKQSMSLKGPIGLVSLLIVVGVVSMFWPLDDGWRWLLAMAGTFLGYALGRWARSE